MIELINEDYLKELDKKGYENNKLLNKNLSSSRKLSMIPITYDKLFKALFIKCQEEFKDFLVETLNLDLTPNDININILNNEMPVDKRNEFKKIADIFIKINDNILLNIEVNRKSYEDMAIRNSRYIGKLIDMEIYNERDYKLLREKEIIQLNINSLEKNKYCKRKLVMYDEENNEIFSKNPKIFLKYVENYRDLYYNGDRKRETIWYAFIASRTYTECYSILLELFDEIKAKKVMKEVIALNSNDYLIHDWENDKLNEIELINATKRAEEKGVEKGIKKGIKKGKEEGKKEGISIGKEELIKNMLNKNMDINLISEIANISLERIEEIKKNI